MSWRAAYRGRRVLVLGASGFIGKQVAEQLGALGADLHLGVRAGASVRSSSGVAHELALAEPGRATALLRAVRPAIVFNLAGYGVDPVERDPALAQRLNTDLVVELATAGAENADRSWLGQQLVHAGSAAEYGSARGDLSEATLPSPTTLYGRTKLAGTGALADASQAGSLRALTARLFTVYGPGERAGRLLPTLIAAADRADAIPLTEGRQQRDFTYVGDIAEGLLRLGALSDSGLGAINLATGKLETVRRFVARAAAVLGISAERLRFGALPTRPEEMAHDPVNLGLLRSLCAWVPATSIEDGVRRTATLL
jgi:nucleoside-diphosphate-sugar epimerase